MTPSDWANTVTAAAATIALFSGLYTFGRQKTTADVQAVLGIFESINAYWDKRQETDDLGKRYYYLGQILSYYENCCFLINRNIVTHDASFCISDHIYEVWCSLTSTDEDRAEINKFISSPTTFCEIKKFVKCKKYTPMTWGKAMCETLWPIN